MNELDTTPVRVGFVMDKAALGQVFLRVLRFNPASFVPRKLHVNKWYLTVSLNKTLKDRY